MNREELILGLLSTAKGEYFSPVQVQKALFLIDRLLGDELGGKKFSFVPYHYGPFDKGVYEDLERLAIKGEVHICRDSKIKSYGTTGKGQQKGESALSDLPADVSAYVAKLSSFVRSLSFSQLVSAIYAAYPEMRANSVFQEHQ